MSERGDKKVAFGSEFSPSTLWGIWRLNLGHQTCMPEPLPAKSSHQT